jgi:hypothetical protein
LSVAQKRVDEIADCIDQIQAETTEEKNATSGPSPVNKVKNPWVSLVISQEAHVCDRSTTTILSLSNLISLVEVKQPLFTEQYGS